MKPIPGLPLLFLDVDGVLNTPRQRMPNGYMGIDPDRVHYLNWIIKETGAGIVVSSSWRYMIRHGAMTLDGFRYLLVIHGLDDNPDAVVGATPADENLTIHGFERIVGTTPTDEMVSGRGSQVAHFLRQWARVCGPTRYVVLDDGGDKPDRGGSMTLTESLRHHHANNLVLVDGSAGLDLYAAHAAIRILKSGPEFPRP